MRTTARKIEVFKPSFTFSIDKIYAICYNLFVKFYAEVFKMSRIKTIETKDIAKTVKNGGCGECQTSCQSACKTSCGVANQKCENSDNK